MLVAYILTEQLEADPQGAYAPYKEYVERNRQRFPPGAYALAASDWYFSNQDHRAPHDAWLESVTFAEPSSGARQEVRSLTLTLRLLGAYHDGHIELRYDRVHAYRLDGKGLQDGHRDFRYDQFAVDDDGHLVHEIEWWGMDEQARWVIVADDVDYRWLPLPA